MSHYFDRLTNSNARSFDQELQQFLARRSEAAFYDAVDVAIVCESTYPYLTGGLSAVVHQICVAHPDLRIGIIHITWDSSSPTTPLYEMPDNVAWVMPVYQSMAEHADFAKGRPADSGLTKREQREAVNRLFSALDAHVAGDDAPLWSLYDDGINPLTRSFRLWPLMSTRSFMARAIAQFGSAGLSFTAMFWKMRELASLAYAATDEVFPVANVYHAHTTGAASLLAAAAARQNGGHFLLTEHNLYTRDTINHGLGRSMATVVQEDDWHRAFSYPHVTTGEVLEPTTEMRAWMLWWTQLGKIAYRAADLITYLYPNAISEAQGLGGIPEKSIVVPNGIAPSHFDAARAVLAERTRTVGDAHVWRLGYAARVVPIKGLLDLLDAMLMVDQAGFTSWHLDVMGPDGEDREYAARCRERVTEAGLDDRVTFHGSVNLRERFGHVDVLLLPSHNEGQPIVVLEAMTIGLPTIGTRVGGMQELIEDPLPNGEDASLEPGGLLVAPHDIPAMANAIVRLMATPGLAEQLGVSAQERVLAHFHIDGAMSQYGSLFRGGLIGDDSSVTVEGPGTETRPILVL